MNAKLQLRNDSAPSTDPVFAEIVELAAELCGVAHGFGLFPFFPFVFILFWFFFARGIFWRGGWHRRGWDSGSCGGVPPAFEEWHRRAHAQPEPPRPDAKA